MATEREKQLAALLLKERIERKTGKRVILKENEVKPIITEGTWAIPKTQEDYIKARDLLKQLITLKDEIYHFLGDDNLFDGLDSAIARGKELLAIAWKDLE